MDATLADRMLANLASSDPSVATPDPTFETAPDELTPRALQPPNNPEEISADRQFTLNEAIDEAFRIQPRLKAQLETIEQARQAAFGAHAAARESSNSAAIEVARAA